MYGESNPSQGDRPWLRWVQARMGFRLQELVCGYFDPSPLERAGDGRLYRALGVPVWRRLLSPARAVLRWLTVLCGLAIKGNRWSAKTLRDARRGTCVVEAFHLPFFVFLLGLAISHLVTGAPDLALRYLALNLLANGYPIMTQRYARVQIDRLLRNPYFKPGPLAS